MCNFLIVAHSQHYCNLSAEAKAEKMIILGRLHPLRNVLVMLVAMTVLLVMMTKMFLKR